MLDKKQIWAIFLSEFRMGWKAMEITLIINNAFSPGAAKNVQCSDGSRSFTKETGALKMRSTVASHQKLTDQMRESSKLILLKLYENLPKNSTLTLLWSFSIWSKLQRWKSPVNGCLLSWLKIKNIIVLKCHLLLFYATTTNHFSIELWHAKKSGFYTTTGNDQISGWTEKKLQSTSQNQTCTPKRSWSLSGGLLTIWYTAAAAARLLQSCPTLFDRIDGGPPGSPVPGILQARMLEWVAISFSNAWKWKVKVKPLNRVWLLATPWTAAYQAPPSMGFSRQDYWSGVPLLSPIWYTTAFWIPAKPLHLRSMLSKSIRCTENCNICSWHWSTERTQFFSITTHDRVLHYQHFKSWTNRAMKFCPICHSHLTYRQPTTISSIRTPFLQGKFFCHQKEAENAFQGFIESQSKYFYATGINKLISCWQKCADCNGSYFG